MSSKNPRPRQLQHSPFDTSGSRIGGHCARLDTIPACTDFALWRVGLQGSQIPPARFFFGAHMSPVLFQPRTLAVTRVLPVCRIAEEQRTTWSLRPSRGETTLTPSFSPPCSCRPPIRILFRCLVSGGLPLRSSRGIPWGAPCKSLGLLRSRWGIPWGAPHQSLGLKWSAKREIGFFFLSE